MAKLKLPTTSYENDKGLVAGAYVIASKKIDSALSNDVVAEGQTGVVMSHANQTATVLWLAGGLPDHLLTVSNESLEVLSIPDDPLSWEEIRAWVEDYNSSGRMPGWWPRMSYGGTS